MAIIVKEVYCPKCPEGEIKCIGKECEHYAHKCPVKIWLDREESQIKDYYKAIRNDQPDILGL